MACSMEIIIVAVSGKVSKSPASSNVNEITYIIFDLCGYVYADETRVNGGASSNVHPIGGDRLCLDSDNQFTYLEHQQECISQRGISISYHDDDTIICICTMINVTI